MNKRCHSSHLLMLFCIVPHAYGKKSSLPEAVQNLFKRSSHEEIIQKEYSCADKKKIAINNVYGSISVASEWGKDTLLVTATKKAAKPELLDTISFNDHHSTKQAIIIDTTCSAESKKVSLDYAIIVPQHLRLELTTHTGDIIIKEAHSDVFVKTTHKGNIEIDRAHGTIHAFAEKTGTITIHQADENIKAATECGNITIHNAKKSIIASTQKGIISIDCVDVPSTSKVALSTQTGNIILRMPTQTNADLQAHTDKGTLLCEHYLTVKPLTTQLNSHAWNRFKKEVDGTIGTGEAHITLHAGIGNIKILAHSLET